MLLDNRFLFEVRRRFPSLRRQPYQERLEGRCPDLPAEWSSIWADSLSQSSLRLSLYYLDLLKSVPWFEADRVINWRDLGSKDFAYASGLGFFLRNWAPSSRIEAIEIDPYQIYFDLYRRFDSGRYHAALVSREARIPTSYVAADWLRLQAEPVQMTSLFFPFLYEDLHSSSGLPRASFDPEAFYRKAFQLTERALFLAHQGYEEFKASLELIQQIGGKVAGTGEVRHHSALRKKHPTFTILWLKEP